MKKNISKTVAPMMSSFSIKASMKKTAYISFHISLLHFMLRSLQNVLKNPQEILKIDHCRTLLFFINKAIMYNAVSLVDLSQVDLMNFRLEYVRSGLEFRIEDVRP